VENRKAKFLLKLLVSSLFFGYLLFKVEWLTIFLSLKKINLLLYIYSFLISLISVFFIASKFFLLIRNTSISHSIISIIKINLISHFYVLFMPTSLGKDAVRWYKITRNKNGRALFFIITIFERLLFVFTILLFGFLPLYLFSINPAVKTLRDQIAPLAIALLSITGTAIYFFIHPQMRNILSGYIIKIVPERWISKTTFMFDSKLYPNRLLRKLFAPIFGLGLLWHIFFIIRLFLLFKAANIPLNFTEVAWVSSLVLFLQVVPVSFAGLGIREGAYAYLLTFFSIAPEQGVLIGILSFSQMLIIAAIGGMLELSNST